MAKNNKEEKPKSLKGFLVFCVLFGFTFAIVAWGYLIKTNRFLGLGEVLRPRLKDVPFLCMILPEITDPDADPNLMAREEINIKYSKLLAENTELQKSIAELKIELSNKQDIESKYDILLKEVERQSKQITEYKEAEEGRILEEQNVEKKIKNLVKIYESMEPAEAASILEEVGELNISLVSDVCKGMKTSTFAEIMQNMSTEFAAILSERMAE